MSGNRTVRSVAANYVVVGSNPTPDSELMQMKSVLAEPPVRI